MVKAIYMISLVGFANPDFDKFPRFRQARAAGQVANLDRAIKRKSRLERVI